MSPEKNYELELEKLKIEQQIEMYRIQKQTETDERKANGYQEAIKMIGSAFEGIGKNIADQLVSNSDGYASPTPAAVNRVNEEGMVDVGDMDEDDDSNPLVGKMTCPDCGQDAVYITKEMYAMGEAGQPVDAACVACGAQHTLGDPGEEISSDPPAAPVQPPAFSQPAEPSAQPSAKKGIHANEEPSRTMRNGKVRPPRRNFVSVD